MRLKSKLIPALLLLWLIISAISCSTHPDKVESSLYLYDPPFQRGEKFLIVQGFAGQKSHQAPIARYAVDIAMPEGTPVCAARSGVVIALYDGLLESISHYVHIRHEDGTIGDYEHLQKASITAKVGDQIQQGKCFARSGNTGLLSTGPHLHFAILRRQGMGTLALYSVPFRFASKGSGIEPKYLLWLKK